MKIALVTETFPPEINGVAMTLGHLVEGLAQRGHSVTVIRPRQNSNDIARNDGIYDELLCPGVPIPGYTMLRLGLPVRGRLATAARQTAEGISWTHVIDGFERDLLEVAHQPARDLAVSTT